MNTKTWHEQSWDDFVAEFTPSNNKTYLVVTRSTFENVYHVEASSPAEAASLVDSDDCCDFYQKHIGEPVIRVAETPLNKDEIHYHLTSNDYF